MSQNKKFSLMDLNATTQGDFVKTVGPVFEHSPWIADTTWSKRPFDDLAQLEELTDRVLEAVSWSELLAAP